MLAQAPSSGPKAKPSDQRGPTGTSTTTISASFGSRIRVIARAATNWGKAPTTVPPSESNRDLPAFVWASRPAAREKRISRPTPSRVWAPMPMIRSGNRLATGSASLPAKATPFSSTRRIRSSGTRKASPLKPATASSLNVPPPARGGRSSATLDALEHILHGALRFPDRSAVRLVDVEDEPVGHGEHEQEDGGGPPLPAPLHDEADDHRRHRQIEEQHGKDPGRDGGEPRRLARRPDVERLVDAVHEGGPELRIVVRAYGLQRQRRHLPPILPGSRREAALDVGVGGPRDLYAVGGITLQQVMEAGPVGL